MLRNMRVITQERSRVIVVLKFLFTKLWRYVVRDTYRISCPSAVYPVQVRYILPPCLWEMSAKTVRHTTATGHVHDGRDFTDPKYVGPGYWVRWHLRTLKLRTEAEQRAWISEFKEDISEFPCGMCREHAQKYVLTNPPERFIGVKYMDLNLGMFVYVNGFHNSVNARIGKPPVSLEEAYNMYSNPAACGATCTALAEEESGRSGQGTRETSDHPSSQFTSTSPRTTPSFRTTQVPEYTPPTGWIDLLSLRGGSRRPVSTSRTPSFQAPGTTTRSTQGHYKPLQLVPK